MSFYVLNFIITIQFSSAQGRYLSRWTGEKPEESLPCLAHKLKTKTNTVSGPERWISTLFNKKKKKRRKRKKKTIQFFVFRICILLEKPTCASFGLWDLYPCVAFEAVLTLVWLLMARSPLVKLGRRLLPLLTSWSVVYVVSLVFCPQAMNPALRW